MKIAPTKSAPSPSSGREQLLPLVPKEGNSLTKDNSVVLELRTVPTDVDSAKIKTSVRILKGDEDLRSMVKWYDDVLNKVFTGLNLTTGPNRKAMALNLMEGNPKSLFAMAVTEVATATRLAAAIAADPDPTAANHRTVLGQPLDQHTTRDVVKAALEAMLTGIMPNKALPRVKRYIRRECRKPADMKVRLYFQLLNRINNAEIPCLPPFDETKRFSDDELMDIVLFGVPKSWLREMDRQGVDPLEKSLGEVVEFLEQIESAEEHDTRSTQVTNKKKGGKKNPSSSGDKYCLIHGHGGHSSDECHKLKAEAKRLKTGGESKPKSSYSNKTWKRNADGERKKSQNELNAFVKKSIKEGVKKELNALSKDKKRKSSDDAIDLNAFDADLKDFNYADMDNLRIDSEDEGEASC